MSSHDQAPDQEPATAGSAASGERKRLSPAAERALAEAAERRATTLRGAGDKPAEIGGRDGPEPTRYGDWEKGGIVSDF